MYRMSEYKDIVDAAIAKESDTAIIDLVLRMFHERDARGGFGRRRNFYGMFGRFYEHMPELALTLLDLIPYYGSWKDMFLLTEFIPADEIFKVAKAQLEADEIALHTGTHLSLLAKWAPREGKQFEHLARGFAYYLAEGSSHKHSQIMASYRKRMARLNKALGTVETLECANRWDEIYFPNVPRAALGIKVAAYLNRNLDGSVRSTDPRRETCRENYMAFTPDQEHLPSHIMSRYAPVCDRVKEWIGGGWRFL